MEHLLFLVLIVVLLAIMIVVNRMGGDDQVSAHPSTDKRKVRFAAKCKKRLYRKSDGAIIREELRSL